MRILLIGVDFKEVNIALGKLSTYHKSIGDEVTLKHLGLTGYPSKKYIKVDAKEFDKVYVSQLFEINTGKYEINNAKDIVYGGIGIDDTTKLPSFIDKMEIDYSIFETDTSYGFITKGCNNNCYFCKVPGHEGKLYKYQDIDDIIRHKRVKFIDNNILMYDRHMEVLQELVDRKIRCCFNQGLDIRRINHKNARLISQLNYMDDYTFAFDNIKEEAMITKNLNILKEYISRSWRIKFFLYHNAEFTSLKDTIYRINWCRDNQVLPYLMRDANCWDNEDRNFLIDLASYCNQPRFFKKMEFESFLKLIDEKYKDKERAKSSLKKWEENQNE